MTRKCHNHRQQTNQWHPEEEIHKVNICCRYSLKASQYETLQYHWNISNEHPAYVLLKDFKFFRKLYVAHQIKENVEKESCPPPPPTPHTPRRHYTYISRLTENQCFPKTIDWVPRGCLQFVIVVFPDHTHLLFLKNEIINMWAQIKPFWTYYLPKIKVSKGAKIRNRYNQVPYLTQDTNGKVTNSQLDTTNESPFPAGDHKAHINRRAQRHSKHKTEKT